MPTLAALTRRIDRLERGGAGGWRGYPPLTFTADETRTMVKMLIECGAAERDDPVGLTLRRLIEEGARIAGDGGAS